MVYDAERRRRDDSVTAEHERLVRETGQERILSRAQNGELVSYLPEEFGNGRKGIGPKITTAGGYIAFVAVCALVTLGTVGLIASSYIRDIPEPPLFIWVIPLMFLAVTVLFARYMMIEVRADRLRKQRGLPTPSEQAV